MARRRRSGLRRAKAKFGRKTKHNLMLMRTRNLGVVGTRGAGVIAWTKGAYVNQDGTNKPYLHLLFSEQSEVLLMEDGSTPMISER